MQKRSEDHGGSGRPPTSEGKGRLVDKEAAPVVPIHPAWEWAGFVFLTLAIFWFLRISWRKWPDPLIDFGRELYLPWRLGEGAVLYRDLTATYGPLSQYFNALVFRVTGVGYMHLVWANLLIYLVILALIYRGLRMGWGRLAAFAGSLVFITVFSFNQLVPVGNYNFLSPYCHEATHGFLLILILIHLWISWLRSPSLWKVASAGFCVGLCVLLKVETLFAALTVTAGALGMVLLERRDLRRLGDWIPMRRLGGWIPIAASFLITACLPSLVATLILWRAGGFSFSAAFSWANLAWTGLFVYRNVISHSIQMRFLGVEDIPGNLAEILIYGCLSLFAVTGLASICQRMKSRDGLGVRDWLLPVLAGLASYWLPWMGWGRTFPVWLCVALFIELRRAALARRKPGSPATHGAGVRGLFLLAAGAFLARMFLNPRIFHYGFFQAALAGVVIVATGFRSLPDLFKLRNGRRRVYLASLGVFFALGLWRLEERSREILSFKTQPIGEGVDRFYGFSPQLDATASLLEGARATLSARAGFRSLLVVPEGVMLNYLLRKPVPVGSYSFTSEWLNWRDQILDGLRKSPPDYVVLITRNLSEYGVDYFGDSPEHGATILAWIRANYSEAWQAGGDPLDMSQRGVTVFQKRGESARP